MATEMLKPCQLTPRHNYVGKPTCAGDKFMIKAKLSIDPDTGEKIAEPGEKVDLDAIIQSYAAQTDIVSIITRLQSGDTSVINVRQDGFEGDTVSLPRNVNDVVNNINAGIAAKNSFDNLPDEVKAAFGNDPAAFFDAIVTNKVDSILAGVKTNYEKAEEVVKEGEKE